MKKRILALLVCLLLTCTSVFAEFTPQIDIKDGERMYNFYKTLMDVTQKQYRFGVTNEQLYDASIKAILKEHPELFDELSKGAYSILDENSKYLTSSEYEDRAETVNGEFKGIGVNVYLYDGVTMVGAPIKGSPAYNAGIKVGDIIVSVDGIDISSYVLDQTIALIRGEKDTTVELGIKRGDELLTFNVVRDVIKINPITYYSLGANNAGYVNISTFNANTSAYLDEALSDLSKQGVDKIILDLRNNLGGLLKEAVAVASYFLPDNTLVVTEDYKDSKKNAKHYTTHTDKKFKVVVLVNDYSASASEIVSAAIKDNKQGVLVGKKTFGKGTVQQSLRMKNGGAMWLTIAKYLTPSGAYIHKVGIEPDFKLSNKKELMNTSKFENIKGERMLQIGDSGKDVLAIEQRLNEMGYPLDSVDEDYDSQTAAMVSAFQKKNGLFSYGVADITTQIKVMDIASETEVTVDNQLEKAKSLILEMK